MQRLCALTSLRRSIGLTILLGSLTAASTAFAQVPAQDTPPGAAATPAASTDTKPALPPYFSGENEKGKPEVWPDPTGVGAGTGAAPASDRKGDVPADLKPTDLYDRIAHNMFSINMVWTL